MTTLPFTVPEDLSPPVALALFEVLQDLTDALWQQYETDLVELIMQECNQVGASQQKFVFDDGGRMINSSFKDYKIPTAKDLPRETEQIFLEAPQPDGPYGARGIAEHPMISVPSAIGNALYDALRIEFAELPLNVERILLRILEERSGKG